MITHAGLRSAVRDGQSRRTAGRVGRPLTIVAIVAVAVLTAAGCGDDDDEVGGYCEDGQCACAGNDCVCPASGDCGLRCQDNCDLQCAGSGSCEFTCDDDCAVRCTGSGSCVARLGARGHIDCTSNGNCEAVCTGPCSMSCTGSGNCSLECANGADSIECGDDIIACGSCP